MGAPIVSNNPLDHDEDLKRLLSRLETVKSASAFSRWRRQFLLYLDVHVAREGPGKDMATVANEIFNAKLESLNEAVDAVYSALDTAALSEQSVSVKGLLALHKMNLLLHQTTEALDRLVPLTTQEENDEADGQGYDKFQLASVLVRDGFASYRRMTVSVPKVAEMRKDPDTSLSKIADKQLWERIQSFQQAFERFCDVMKDLGMYRIMVEAAKYGDELNSPGLQNDDMVIVIDLKTGQIGELFREECLARNLLSILNRGEGGDDGTIAEMARGKCAREALRKLVLDKLQ